MGEIRPKTCEGGELTKNQLEPEPNTEGVFILVGLIGTLAAIALAVFALPRVRRARYDLFYLVHVPAAALFIVMGAVHEFEMQVSRHGTAAVWVVFFSVWVAFFSRQQRYCC